MNAQDKIKFDELEDKFIEDMTDEELKELIDKIDWDSIPTCPIFRFREFSFEGDDDLQVFGRFLELNEKSEEYGFVYKVNESEFQSKVVPYSIYVRILVTITIAIQDFINEHEPVSIFLKSNPRKEGQVQDKAKHRIHGHILKMQIHKVDGYDYKELEDGWLIFRK